MDYKEYKQMVIESEKGSLTRHPKILHAMMGMNGEAGECIDILKKHMFQGHDLDSEHLLMELGDVCWYTMLFAIEADIDLDLIFGHIDNLIHTKLWKDKPLYMGVGYILDINDHCGDIMALYYNSIGSPRPIALEPLRYIFYDVKMAANIFGVTLEEVFDINYEKIKIRYPEGFEIDKSINRRENI